MRPLLAVRALQAFQHVNPFAVDADGQQTASEEQLELAAVGALLVNELVSNSRGLVEKPMQITFLAGLGGGPRVVEQRLEDLLNERPAPAGRTLPADRTGRTGGDPAA